MEQLSRRGLLWGIAALAVPVWKPLEVLATPTIWTNRYNYVPERWPVGDASFISTDKDAEAYEQLTDRLAEVMSAVSYLTVYRVNSPVGFFPLGVMMRPFTMQSRSCETELSMALAAEHKGREAELIDILAKNISFEMHHERNRIHQPIHNRFFMKPDILLIHSVYGVKGIKVKTFQPTLGFVVRYAWYASSDSKDARPLEVVAVSDVKRILTVPTAALTVGMADDVQVPDGERQGFALSYQSV